jgi:hypothetical protein
MAADLNPVPDTAVAALKAVIDDAQKLLQHQIDLLRAEVRADWLRAKRAAWIMAIGAGLLATGLPLLAFMLVYGVHWHWAPTDADPGSIPLWVCFGIVGGAFAGLGAILAGVAISKFKAFNPLPDQTAKSLEENVRWLTNGAK